MKLFNAKFLKGSDELDLPTVHQEGIAGLSWPKPGEPYVFKAIDGSSYLMMRPGQSPERMTRHCWARGGIASFQSPDKRDSFISKINAACGEVVTQAVAG